jgi:DNA-binding response OmpR family regulator
MTTNHTDSQFKPLALIIEDNPHLADIFAIALQQAEFRTEIARDGNQARDQLATISPHLVLLDLHLPYVSGKDILSYIRNDPRLAEIHVIVATADANQAELLYRDADLVLLKPISLQQLRDLAARLRPPDIIGIISEE